jgi:hypothetical protein
MGKQFSAVPQSSGWLELVPGCEAGELQASAGCKFQGDGSCATIEGQHMPTPGPREGLGNNSSFQTGHVQDLWCSMCSTADHCEQNKNSAMRTVGMQQLSCSVCHAFELQLSLFGQPLLGRVTRCSESKSIIEPSWSILGEFR